MKRLVSKIFMVFAIIVTGALMCRANVYPTSVLEIPDGAIGLYQTDKEISVYSKPSEKGTVVYQIKLDYSTYDEYMDNDMFAVLVPKKELGYLYVTDISDDEQWLQVVYSKPNDKRGWVRKKDDFQFLPWGNFISLYGRKYGLVRLKTGFAAIDEVYSESSYTGKILGTLAHPRYIKMTSIEGNWILMTGSDYTGDIYTGYIPWRTDDGKLLLFPDLK